MSIANLWDALRTEGRAEPGCHLRRVDPHTSCELFAALRQPGGTPGLLLEVPADAVPADLELPESRGFSVEPQLVGPSHGGSARFALWLRDPAYSAIFLVLCENVIAAAQARAQAGPRQSLRAWIGRLHTWQDFMERHGPGGLSEEAALGLLGELVVIQEDLSPLVGLAAAVRSWAGPHGEPNDFEFSGNFLEVKSTSRQAAQSLQISSADQLDDSRGRILLLHQRLSRDPHGVTLPEAVEALRQRVAVEAPQVVQELDLLLLQAGYLDAHAPSYRNRYLRDRMTIFRVDGDFPRVRRADLRPGVRDCAYVIDLASCSPLAAPEGALVDLARARGDG